MKKGFSLVSLLVLTTFSIIAQKWEFSYYKDEWGDPTGKRLIKQKVEGLFVGAKIIVEISRDVPTTDDFKIRVVNPPILGKVFEPDVTILNPPTKKELKKNPFMDPTVGRDIKIEEGKYLFKYKIGQKESSFSISRPNAAGIRGTGSNSIYVNYPELNAILLSTSLPIKCIIARKRNDGTMYNMFSFTLNPDNYKQVAQ